MQSRFCRALLLGALGLAAGCSTFSDDDRGDGKVPRASRPGALPRGVVFRWQQRAGPTGEIPAGALVKAARQRDAMRALDGSGVRVAWQWMGPGNIGGRVRAILIHPKDPRIMWVGAASGGVWKTTNSGARWDPADKFLTALPIGSMALDPRDPDRLYVGTGEGFFDSVAGSSNLAAVRGAGIFVSTDGAATWKQLKATANWAFCNRIAIDPKDSRVILAATDQGIYRTTDQGASWTRTTTGNTMDVRFHPTDSTKAVAGTGTGLALWSTNGGRTWSKALGLPAARRVEVRYYRKNPSVVFAAVSDPRERIYVYRSTDGGRTYTRRSTSGISTYSRYNNVIWVDPTDERRIFLGGVRLYRSTDGGVTFSAAYNGGYYDYHVLVEHPAYDGVRNRVLFSGSDGGVHRLDDTAAWFVRWQELNNNLGINQFYGAAIHKNGTLIGGTQDQGTLHYYGGTETWRKVFGGDGGFCAIDPASPSYVYAEWYWLNLLASSNGGRTFRRIRGNITERGNFIPPLVLDPNAPRRLYAGGASLWRTDDARAYQPFWKIVKPKLSCPSAHYGIDPPCNISAITVASGDSNVVWVGHNNGRLYVSTNALAASPTWTRVDAALPDRWIARIVTDPRDKRRAYVSLMGYTSGNVWVTEDLGRTWKPRSGSGAGKLPDIPVPALAVHPRIPGAIFAGTDLGLFFSSDDGNSWSVVPGGPINVPIEELAWRDERTLMVATHGRGIYLATLRGGAVKVVGRGCGKSGSPSLSVTAPTLGKPQTYTAAGLAGNAAAHLLFAVGGAKATPLGNGCVLQIDPANFAEVPVGSTAANGSWSRTVQVPADPSLIGALLTTQLATVVQGGPALGVAELTNGVELTFDL